MFNVHKGYTEFCLGTFRVGDILVSPSDLILLFGKPGKSDGYKISGEYSFHNVTTGAVFTIYDWKCTSLYDSDCPNPEDFWSRAQLITFNIGGNDKGNIEEFKQLIHKQIEWIKVGKPFEQEVIGTITSNSDSFLIIEE